MTRSTESVATTITITSTSSIATRTKTKPIPIGFLPSYLPSSTDEIGPLSLNKNPPYPLDVTSVDKAPPPYPLENELNNQIHHRYSLKSQDSNKAYGNHLHPPYFGTMASNDETKNSSSDVNFRNEIGLENFGKEVIMIALQQMKCKALWKTDEEKKEFFKAQTKVMNIINDRNSSLSIEEKEKFEKEAKKMNEIRNKYLKEEKERNKVEENGTTDVNNDETGDSSGKCSFDITLLLLKIPQLLVDVIICVKGGMTGITTFFGAMFFTLSLTAGLFTTYYLILYCLCRQSKRTRISEFLHSLICNVAFFLVSFYSIDSDLMAFGFLAMVPYGSEVCWTTWNFIKVQK